MGKSEVVMVSATKIPTDITVDPPSVSSGDTPLKVRIQGMLRDATNLLGIPGAIVYLMRRRVNEASWHQVGSAWTNSNVWTGVIGQYWIDNIITETGDWEFMVEFRGDATFEGC